MPKQVCEYCRQEDCPTIPGILPEDSDVIEALKVCRQTMFESVQNVRKTLKVYYDRDNAYEDAYDARDRADGVIRSVDGIVGDL